MKSLLLIVSFSSSMCFSQALSNGSFEFSPIYGQDVVAPGWEKCVLYGFNTPDLLPGFWEIMEPASEGYAYQSLTVDESGKHESLYSTISPPLAPGNCYKISVDARVSTLMIRTLWGETRDYTNPAKLILRLGQNHCSMSVFPLVINSLVKGEDWRTFSFIYTPQDSMRTISLLSDYTTAAYYFGHVFVDNVQISQSGDTTKTVSLTALQGEGVTLSMPTDNPSYQYEWSSGEFNCDSCASNTILAENDTVYYGIVRDTSSCYYEVHVFKIQIKEDDSNTNTEVFTIYPNPATTELTLSVHLNDSIDQIQITNIHGQIITEQTFDPDLVLIFFDVERYTPGMYFINLISNKKIIASKKWIKQTPN